MRSVAGIVHLLQVRGAAKIKVIGHRGKGETVTDFLRSKFEGVEFDDTLRDDSREKENSAEMAAELAGDWDLYVNEAFAVSHRKHTSLVALPQVMKTAGKEVCAGPRLLEEVRKLSEVFEREGKKVLVVGGAKAEDKVGYAKELALKTNLVLMGGRLPLEAGEVPANVRLGKLREDGLDIDEQTIADFCVQLADAEVIVMAGPMGKFEDETASGGTKGVYTAAAGNHGYKVAGGGDTEAALALFDLGDHFDWVSVGGGAMLEFLAKGTLPGLEALE